MAQKHLFPYGPILTNKTDNFKSSSVGTDKSNHLVQNKSKSLAREHLE
jgi:hypothetical protein